MECPGCNQDGAYVGLQWIHCQNSDCQFFDARYTSKVREEKASSFTDTVEKLILLQGEVADLED